jgi:hypothetical protein
VGAGAAINSARKWQMPKRHAASTPSQARSASSTGAPPAPRVALPNDLSTSLRHLDDAELHRLHQAVSAEISRRNEAGSIIKPGKATMAGHRSPASRNEVSRVEEIPEGKANLIRASFGAGLKPTAIARMFRVSPSLVNRIIRSAAKPQP